MAIKRYPNTTRIAIKNVGDQISIQIDGSLSFYYPQFLDVFSDESSFVTITNQGEDIIQAPTVCFTEPSGVSVEELLPLIKCVFQVVPVLEINLNELQAIQGANAPSSGNVFATIDDLIADDQTAAEVPFTPDGDITATDTQAAVVEVRDDTDTKLALKEDSANKGVANGYASLDGSGTIPLSEIPAGIAGGLTWKGLWNASTNTPALASGVGTNGDTYEVSVAGATNLDGITDWEIGDLAVFNGADSTWEKIDNTDKVTSVFGRDGVVVAVSGDYTAAQVTNAFDKTADDTDDITEGATNKFNQTHTGDVTGATTLTIGPLKVTNDMLAGSIDNSKLLTDPLARANHTGTQLASTISDFADTVRNTILTGISFASTATITAADSVLTAFGKLQAQVTLNNAKVTNATHTGEVTGATALTVDKTAISNKTLVDVDPLDHFIIGDASDTDNLKKVQAGDFLTGSGTILATITGIDATAVGDTNLYTVPAGKETVVRFVIIRLQAISGGGAVPKVAIGTNATSYDNIVAQQSLTGLTAIDNAFTFAVQGVFKVAQAAEIIKLRVNPASARTTYTIDVDLIGYTI